MKARVDSTWRDCLPHVRTDGTWKPVREALVKVGGVWKKVFPTTPLYTGYIEFVSYPNHWWSEQYSFISGEYTGLSPRGSISHPCIVSGETIISAGITKVATEGGGDYDNRLEIGFLGDKRYLDIPTVYFNGMASLSTEPRYVTQAESPPLSVPAITFWVVLFPAPLPNGGRALIQF